MSKNNLIVINDTDPNRFNCVKYARSKVPNLPYGLFTILNKKKIINSDSSHIGDVAIISTGFIWGHVAVVIAKSGSRKTIREANWISGKITERTGKTKELKILGYFHP